MLCALFLLLELKWVNFRTHNAGGTPYLFPRDLFVKFIMVIYS
jgi:hypothetical protein